MYRLEVNSLTDSDVKRLASHFEISKEVMASVILSMGFSNLCPGAHSLLPKGFSNPTRRARVAKSRRAAPRKQVAK